MKNKLVLLIDDDERNLFALSSYLETQGFETVTACNGAQAILMLRDNLTPGIILLDIMMPIMNGYQMLGYISHTDEFKQIPIIVVTAKASKEDEEKCLAAGARDYIPKPIDVKILVEKMTRLMV